MHVSSGPLSASGWLAFSRFPGLFGERQCSRVDRLTVPRQHLKPHRVLAELRENEAEVGVESCCRQRPFPDVALSQLRRPSFDEVMDPVLRLDSFVEVLMSGENDVHPVLDEEWL